MDRAGVAGKLGAAWRQWRQWRLVLAVALQTTLAACGGGDAGDAGAQAVAPVAAVTTITLMPAAASLGVGQTRSLAAEARDQSGAVMPGVALTWASSNNAVAVVVDGVATGVAAGAATITASSGGVTSNTASLTVIAVAIGKVAIDKPMAYFSAIGQSAQLTAQALDPLGAPAPSGVVWTSSAPDKISVDATGQIVARAIGSAQIFAVAAGVRSAPTLVVVAEPVPGALLVTDTQVVSVGPPLGLAAGAAPGVGTEYEVTLQGVAAPAPGTVVIAAEAAPVAGKVVAARQEAAGLVVTLAIVPLYQLFNAYDINWTIELAAFPFEPVPTLAAAAAQGAARKTALLSRSRVQAAMEPFKPLECSASLTPQFIDTKVQLAPEVNLTLVVQDRPGYSKRALEGSATLTGSAGVTLQAGFNASGKCETAQQVKVKAAGWLAVLPLPAVRYGFGVKLSGEVRVVQGELGVEGKIGFNPVVGWECGGATAACRSLDTINQVNKLKTTSRMPSLNDMQVKLDGQFYLLAGLDVSLLAGADNAKILEVRVGPKQHFDLAFEDDQAARTDYASSYDLKLLAVVEPGKALKKAIETFIGDDATSLTFKAEASTHLSESPKGNLSVSKSRVAPGGAVDFTVVLDPKTVDYDLLGYNVVGVELYRKRENEPAFTQWKSMPFVVSGPQTTFTYQWKPVEADAGKYEFAAFVNTQLLTPLLEIAPNSIQPVEVTCFSAGALAATSGSRKQRLAAAANGTGVTPLANACFGTWSGTSSMVVKTPGLPDVNIASKANIIWTYDPSLSGNGSTYYTPSGSFDLAFNDGINGCTYALSPSNFTIVNDPPPDPNDPAPTPPVGQGRLGITNDGFNPMSYGFGGMQRVNTTVTASCPGKANVVSQLTGFQVGYASGTGPFTIGQTNLSGSTDDGHVASTWNFNQP